MLLSLPLGERRAVTGAGISHQTLSLWLEKIVAGGATCLPSAEAPRGWPVCNMPLANAMARADAQPRKATASNHFHQFRNIRSSAAIIGLYWIDSEGN